MGFDQVRFEQPKGKKEPCAVLTLVRPLLTIPGARWDPAGAVVHVPGSVLPLALILSLFAVKYAAGASLALHPALAADPLFCGTFSLG